MKGKRFTEEQIIRILQEAETGLAVADIFLKHNCSDESVYGWMNRFGCVVVSAVEGLREPDPEQVGLEDSGGVQTLAARVPTHRDRREWLPAERP